MLVATAISAVDDQGPPCLVCGTNSASGGRAGRPSVELARCHMIQQMHSAQPMQRLRHETACAVGPRGVCDERGDVCSMTRDISATHCAHRLVAGRVRTAVSQRRWRQRRCHHSLASAAEPFAALQPHSRRPWIARPRLQPHSHRPRQALARVWTPACNDHSPTPSWSCLLYTSDAADE